MTSKIKTISLVTFVMLSVLCWGYWNLLGPGVNYDRASTYTATYAK